MPIDYSLDKRVCVRIPLRDAAAYEELMEKLHCRTWSRLVKRALRELLDANPLAESDNFVRHTPAKRQTKRVGLPLFETAKVMTRKSRKKRKKVPA
jgi:hypothetical protein